MNSNINYKKLPAHIQAGVQQYVEQGIIPGDFLQAVIANNLSESFALADEINQGQMFNIVKFFYNEMPSACWKSKEKMLMWNKIGGYANYLKST